MALTAHVGLDRIFKESHQIVDLVSVYQPVTKWAQEIRTPAAVPEMLRKAFDVAQSERPGAVYLALPEDIAAKSAANQAPLCARPWPTEACTSSPAPSTTGKTSSSPTASGN